MKGITIKLPDALYVSLAEEAKETGRSIGAVVRKRLEAAGARPGRTVFAQAADLAGSVAGGRKAVTNDRKKFVRR